jgi:hypothetical protein
MTVPGSQVAAVNAFRKFIESRPGIDANNYSNYRQLRREYANVARQKARAFKALMVLASHDYDTALLESAMRSYSGRLSFDDKGQLEYCAGQYYCVEYRQAAAVVLEDYADLVARKAAK